MKIFAAWVGLLLVTCTASADVYKWKDDKGQIHYSDRPVEGAELVKSIPLSTYKSPPLPSRLAADDEQPPASPTGYKTFTFVSPANDATIRDNAGNIAVQLSIDPPLQEGHSIAMTIDGNRAPTTVKNTTFTLSNVNRGTHTLQASVVDGEGNTLIETATTTIHMQRASILNPNSPLNKK